MCSIVKGKIKCIEENSISLAFNGCKKFGVTLGSKASSNFFHRSKNVTLISSFTTSSKEVRKIRNNYIHIVHKHSSHTKTYTLVVVDLTGVLDSFTLSVGSTKSCHFLSYAPTSPSNAFHPEGARIFHPLES